MSDYATDAEEKNTAEKNAARKAVSEFLADNEAFSSVCDAVDVACVWVSESDGNRTLLSLRVTLGRSMGAPLTPQRLTMGRWTACRFRREASFLSRTLSSLVEGRSVEMGDGEAVSHSIPSSGWYLNGFVKQSGVFDAGQTSRTWLGNSGTRRAFPSSDDHRQFARAVDASADFHDVETLVNALQLRQQLSSDDQCGVRFEIEAPLYDGRADWRDAQVVTRFRAPDGMPLADFRVKWRTPQGSGVALMIRDDHEATATIETSVSSMDATVLFRDYALRTLAFDRPAASTALTIDVDDEEIGETSLAEGAPDYSRYDTTRLALRRSAKKQVNRKQDLYLVVARDIEDAIWCTQNGRHKLAAILAGGIMEAVLHSRLESETPPTIRAALQAKFPNVNSYPALDDMKLYQLVGVAQQLRKLKNPKLYDGIRDCRNLVHPAAELREGSVDANTASIVVTAAVNLLLGRA